MSELWLPKEVSVDYYKDYSEEGDCSGLVTALAAVRSIDYDTETSSVRYSMITGNRGTHADLMMCAGGVDGRYFALPAGMAYRSGMVNGSRCVGGPTRYDSSSLRQKGRISSGNYVEQRTNYADSEVWRLCYWVRFVFIGGGAAKLGG